MNKTIEKQNGSLANPPWLNFLFENPKWSSWIWLVVRLYLGYGWLTAGYEKLINPVWMNGTAIKGFWTTAVKVSGTGHDPISYDWYRSFIQLLIDTNSQTWFGGLVAVGEVLIGLSLILGLFTWFGALMGGFMNWNYLMAGTASVNGLYLVLSFLLVLAWKVAGYWGLDRWFLGWFGTPWQPGTVFHRK
jgi:thiosulfate dehydrogenase (quinone) large subunit